MKILIADDDSDLRGLIGFALRQTGYLVVEADDGVAALQLFQREQPDLAILDVNMPGMNGFDVCKHIRAESTTPLMLLTVRSGEEDQVYGLDIGADDYLTKPFSPRTLLARVRALLRRSGAEPVGTVGAGDLTLDVERQAVQIRGGTAIRLTHLEYRLLQYLLANAGHVITAERLTTHVWGYQNSSDRQLLKQLVHRLRQKVESDVANPHYVVTVPGIGYIMYTGADDLRAHTSLAENI
jgi:DNA-binding response OmpR family regulator